MFLGLLEERRQALGDVRQRELLGLLGPLAVPLELLLLEIAVSFERRTGVGGTPHRGTFVLGVPPRKSI